MKMKNVLMILISLAVVFAMAGAAGAAGENEVEVNQESQDQSKDILVTYTMNEGYIVTIPAGVALSMANNAYVANGSEEISADKVRINAGKVLTVKISGDDYVSDDNKWVLKETGQGSSGNLTYTIKNDQGNELENGAVVLSVLAGRGWDRGSFTQVSETLSFETEEVTISGSFEDTLTFTVSVESSQTP